MRGFILCLGILFTSSWALQTEQDVSGVEREEILTEKEVMPTKRSEGFVKETVVPNKKQEKGAKKCGCGCCHGCGCGCHGCGCGCHGCGCHGCGCCDDCCDCCHHTCGGCCGCNGCDCVESDSCHMGGCECCHGCCGCCGDCCAHCCEPPQHCVCHGCGCDCHGCGCKKSEDCSKGKTKIPKRNTIPRFNNIFQARRGLIPFSGIPFSSHQPLTYATPYKAPYTGAVLNSMYPRDVDHVPTPYISEMAGKRQIIPHGLWGWDEFGRMGHGMGGQEYGNEFTNDCEFAPAFGFGHMLRFPMW